MKLGPYDLDSIHVGECSELMAALPDACIDLTVTSPPYDNLREYEGFVFPFEAIAQQLWRVTKPGGVVVWVVGDATINGSETGTSFRQALRFKEIGFNLHDTMIYKKENPIPVMSKHRYTQSFEYMFVFSRGSPSHGTVIQVRTKYPNHPYRVSRNNATSQGGGAVSTKDKVYVTKETRDKDNIWEYASESPDNYCDHPAAFPEDLARDHILSWSNPGDVVLDPMIGSGTTAKMAKELGRHWLGFDVSPRYVEIARRRVEGARVPLFTYA